MPRIAETKNARKDDSEFVIQAARAFYVAGWWMNTPAGDKIGGGRDIAEEAPATPRWAFRLAREFVADLESPKFYGQPLPAILADLESAWEGDRDYSEGLAGWYAAMEALGHGVGLFLFGIDVKLPHVEAYPR